MSGLLGFSRVPEESCFPAWCMARTLFASMQQCPCGRARHPRTARPVTTVLTFGPRMHFAAIPRDSRQKMTLRLGGPLRSA